MKTQTIETARIMRDGAIDAMAALNAAVELALVDLPQERAAELKHATGDAMGEICEKIIFPAIRAFPELELDQAGWSEVARTRARARSSLNE
ncbi:hypothetical protein [Pseudoduganella violaceinigra]|uniref:hypothetical protein n=1 Tax=Pseudoduganella violaceinigra TaxID=246602 RepID=UPI00048483A5|nr:hypothetical protein [Pseudoduganella violaceinigra]